MRVCYFGLRRPHYPRHQVISRGLRRLGVEIAECFVSHRLKGRQLQLALWAEFAKTEGAFDALLVAEFNHSTGIFGNSPKARRVVPHRLYQGLAVGRPIVS